MECLEVIENMVARDGVEPPTPAFSGATETVLALTYKDVEGCETPVSTRKNTRITGSGDGLPFRQNSHTEPWVTG